MNILLQVGEFIMSKGGAVTAEQLAPYLDVQPGDLERVDGQVNEDFVVSSCLMNLEQLDDCFSPCHCTAHSN